MKILKKVIFLCLVTFFITLKGYTQIFDSVRLKLSIISVTTVSKTKKRGYEIDKAIEYFVFPLKENIRNFKKLQYINYNRDSIFILAFGEPYIQVNERFFNGSLPYYTYKNLTGKLIKRKRHKIYKKYDIEANCLMATLSENDLMDVIEYNRYHFKLLKPSVFIILPPYNIR